MQFKSGLAIATLMAATTLAANSTHSSIPSSCSLGSSATATAQSDLDKYAGCQTLVGNLTITGDLGSAALANVEEIDGSLIINNATLLSTFSADSVKTITGALTLQQLTVLATASFGSLTKVDSISLITLPGIETFSSELESANQVLITDTSLESVDGFSTLTNCQVFNINNNNYLTTFKSALQSVSDSLQFSYNGQATNVTFDQLVWANNITLRDVKKASFAKLQAVNASIGFFNNSLTSLDLSKLTQVGETFTVVSNDELTSLKAGNLTKIGGGFVVANNTALSNINGFSKLETVGGAIIVTGNYSALDLSSLKSVKGGADFESSSSNFSCTPFKKLASKGNIQGTFICKNGATSTSIKLSSTSGSGSSKTSSGSSATSSSESTSSTSSKSKGAAVAQLAPVSTFMGAIGAVLLAML
ncbi:hypothetical protein NCAS_0I01420 [Naumovozyma castellii]|uniref:Uncharacterized protein n=1 Tax=Naumovozyma castellii TaxID=27288 RepID=G0VJX8_NAUCA|nr:hypothetical protein NCAS_0I01420 [Naumovozyma castellii CBS 4309]CCC71810.1 hypothetical protein NCAS_0I01420 [Naumovozyma castellii CBS 4309]